MATSYEEAKQWVEKVINSCETQAHILSAIKLAANYFNMYVFKPNQGEKSKLLMFTSSPLYAQIREKQLQIKFAEHEKIL